MGTTPALVDLLKWFALQRSQSDLRGDRGRHLAKALGADPDSPSSLSEAVDEAVAAMDPGPHQEAARWLVGSGPLRWEALKSRQHEAAKVFDVKTDAFRRKRSGDRPSRETEVLSELARTISATRADEEQGDEEGADGEGTAPSPSGRRRPVAGDEAGPFSSRWANRLVPATGLAAAVGLVLVGWLVARSLGSLDPDPPLVVALPEGCPHEVGDLEGVTDEHGFGDMIRSHFRISGGEEELGCPLTPVELLPDSPLAYQEYGTEGETPGLVILGFEDGRSMTLPFAAWGSYRQIGGRSGDQAYAIAGEPIGLRITGSVAYVELETDVQLIAEAAEAPYFFVIPLVTADWAARGGLDGELGRPTSNPHMRDGRWRQEFESGWLEAATDLKDITWHAVDEPRQELPADEAMAGRIVGQLDGTAWFVTEDLHRMWIPDGLVWDCLGGAAEAVSVNVPGYAVAQLPYAGLATCEQSRIRPLDFASYCASIGSGRSAAAIGGTADWACVQAGDETGTIDLDHACLRYGADRQLVTLAEGDPLGWRCASSTWTPLLQD
jgi:hypothetical protein